jgi:hypothetical protein
LRPNPSSRSFSDEQRKKKTTRFLFHFDLLPPIAQMSLFHLLRFDALCLLWLFRSVCIRLARPLFHQLLKLSLKAIRETKQSQTIMTPTLGTTKGLGNSFPSTYLSKTISIKKKKKPKTKQIRFTPGRVRKRRA